MGEGEFKKRMDKRYRQFLVAEGDLLSLMNDMVWKDFFNIVDEAAYEFPTYGIGDTPDLAELDGKNKINKWFLKWFGSENGHTQTV